MNALLKFDKCFVRYFSCELALQKRPRVGTWLDRNSASVIAMKDWSSAWAVKANTTRKSTRQILPFWRSCDWHLVPHRPFEFMDSVLILRTKSSSVELLW